METIRIASSSYQILCHEWSEGELLNTYQSSTNATAPINSISWARDTPWLVFVSKHQEAEIVSFEGSARSLASIRCIQHSTCACFQTSTKRCIAVGTNSGKLLIYDVKTKVVKKSFRQAPSSLFKVQYGLKDTHIISACLNGEVFVHNINSALLSCSFKVPNSKTLTNFRCHPCKRNLLAGCSEEGVVAVWDINNSKTVMCAHNHNMPVTDVAFSDQGLLACAGMDRRICLTDSNTGKIVTDIKVDRVPTAIEFSPDGNGYAVGFLNGKLLGYDLRKASETTNQYSGHSTRVNQIAFQRVGKDNENFISQPEDSEKTIESVKSVGCDSFSNIYCGDVLAQVPEKDNEKKGSENACDSFIVTMSPCSNNVSFSAFGIMDNGKKSLDAKASEIKQKKRISELFKKHSSTPTSSGTEAEPSGLSPIYKPTTAINNDIRQMLKETVREVIKEEIGDIRKHFEQVTEELQECKKFIEYQNYLLKSSTSSQFLALQMCLVKESIKVEDNLNQLREELCLDGNGNRN